jgi:hypothetical protein
MPVNAVVVQVANIARGTSLGTSTAIVQRPVRTGERGIGSERTASGKRAILSFNRDRDGTTGALDGTLAVYGADLASPTAGTPLGNAFAQSATATSVRPQVAQVIGDGTTTAFTTTIDLLSGDLAAAIAAGNILVDMPSFALTGTIAASTAGVLTGTGTKFSAGVTSAKGGGELAIGDTVVIGGLAGTITSVISDTVAAWDQTTAVSAGATGINTSRYRRFRFVVGTGAGATGDPEVVEATVSNSKLVLTFKVAPVKQGEAPSGGIQTPGGVLPLEVGAAHLVTRTEMLADAANPFGRTGVRSRTVVWAVTTASAGGALSATQVRLEHASD